ncbi:piggyBac transposable element-derived protein 4-like [Epinephelus fuscoguttatus]|uniref:piggyBac transposable element-derived protein 4-like n=1 Tax=Epinephelus fuscoguttatus TaxID=293821 RepID=UPI0020D1C454|nr:piggyBac transposable element-derived protein 4-like [Epinephelus fuscoguttatus]
MSPVSDHLNSSPGSVASSIPLEDSDSVSSSGEDWVPSEIQESSEDEYSRFPGENEMRDEDDNPMEKEETKWVSRNKNIKWSPSAEQMHHYVQPPTTPVPGPTAYAKRNVTDRLTSCLDLFLTNDIIQLILRMTNLEGQRTRGHWKEITETELRGFFGLLLLAGLYRSRGESTRSLWGEEMGRPVFRGTMSYKRFEELAMKLRFDDKLSRRNRLSDNKLAAILPVWEPWVQRLPLVFNPGVDVCVDEQLVAFKGCCSFKQYMPNKPARNGIKVWTLVDVSTSYAWNMAIYSGKEGASREVGQRERVVLQMTQGLKGRTVTTDNVFTSYGLGAELLQRKMAMVGMVRKSKPELPPQLLTMSGREEPSSIFAHTETHTAVSYKPKKGKGVVLMSTKHRDASVSREAHQKPTIILDYNRCKGGVDKLEKYVTTYSCRRKTSRWPMALFYNLLDVSAYNSYVLWTCLHPKWEITKKKRRRIFLEQLGKELVTPCILQRERIPRTPSAAALVQAAQAVAVKEEPRDEDDDEDTSGLIPPVEEAQAKGQGRQPCEMCPKTLKRCRVRNVCAKCGIFLCKNHTWKCCALCVGGGQCLTEDSLIKTEKMS